MFSIATVLSHFAFGSDVAAMGLLGLLALFAMLEAGLGFCAGCFVFNRLMRLGVIPASVCRECEAGMLRSRAG